MDNQEREGFFQIVDLDVAGSSPVSHPLWGYLSHGDSFMVRLWGLVSLLLFLSGCGPALSKQDLGTVVFEVPKVAGADEPYQMSQLGPPLEPKDGPFGRGLGP